jgi:hypothetical protein
MGRLDITQFTDTLVPAYATDIYTTEATTDTLSIATFDDLRVFTLEQGGVYVELDAIPVASGTISTGDISFGLPDPKTAVAFRIDSAPLVDESYGVVLTNAAGTVTDLGAYDQAGSTSFDFPCPTSQSERFDFTITLTAGVAPGPTLLRWTLKAIPSTSDGPSEIFHIPIQLYPKVNMRGKEYDVDVSFERTVISNLRASRQVITYQEIDTSYTGIVSDFRWLPYGLHDQEGTGNWDVKGTLVVEFQRTG